VPFWFLPFAIVCGNTFILKPSEQVPLTQNRAYEILHELGLPAGVVNLVNGDAEVVNAILDSPGIDAVSFVGSARVARHVYERAGATGKRVQALGGAKNHMVVMPDAVVDKTVSGIISSAFGAAGQRCMAGSVVVTVGEAQQRLLPPLADAARELRMGNGADPDVAVGPVISCEARDRIGGWIDRAASDGATVLVDGRDPGRSDGAYHGYRERADGEPRCAADRGARDLPFVDLARAAVGVLVSADRELAVLSRRGSRSSTRTRPESAVRKPSQISTVVVLPAPLGPSSAVTPSRGTPKLTPANARTVR